MENSIILIGKCSEEEAAKVGGQVTPYGVEVPFEYMANLFNNSEYLVIVSEMLRPGVQMFSTKVEHMLFPPDQPDLNCLFQLGIFKWSACNGFPFVVMVLPAEAKLYVENIAQECDLRLTDNVVAVLNNTSVEKFPIVGSSVKKIENLPNSAVYATALNVTGGVDQYQQRMDALLKTEKAQTIKFLRGLDTEAAREEVKAYEAKNAAAESVG